LLYILCLRWPPKRGRAGSESGPKPAVYHYFECIQSVSFVKTIARNMTAFVAIEVACYQKQAVVREYELMLVAHGMNRFQAVLLMTV